jgi:1,4-alpha-glucan branching enzyme
VIKKKQQKDGFVQVIFALPDVGEPVSVVADANGWDPLAHPMKKRTNGTRSVAINVPKGSSLRFRYLSADGQFFNDPEGDGFEDNGFGDTHTVVHA